MEEENAALKDTIEVLRSKNVSEVLSRHNNLRIGGFQWESTSAKAGELEDANKPEDDSELEEADLSDNNVCNSSLFYLTSHSKYS